MSRPYDPAERARTVEWVILDSWQKTVQAIIRVHSKDAYDEEPWYKVTTGEKDPTHRQLIGWARSLSAASQVAIDFGIAEAAWNRKHTYSDETMPAPAELVAAYRERLSRIPERG